MPRTPDRRPGPLVEEEIRLEDRTADGPPSVGGAIRYVSGRVTMRDVTGTYDPREARGAVLIPRAQVDTTTVPAGFTLLWHDAEISDGAEIIIEDTGEVLCP